MIRLLLLLLVIATGALPTAAMAQRSEENETEFLESLADAQSLPESPDLEKTAAIIVRRTNEFREAEGLSSLAVNNDLREAAQYFADYMARTDTYGHHADGQGPAQRATEHGYDYCIVLENIAYHYRSSGFTAKKLGRQAFRGWKQSPGHRKNMLDPDVTETGVALAQSEKTGYFYAVQMFGRPRRQAIEFSIANDSGATVRYEIADKAYTLPPRLTRTHTRCRPSRVTFHWPDSEGDAKVVKPDSGDRFTVEKAGDEFRLERD